MEPNKLGIIFLHHSVDEVVENNLLSVRRHNPQATVITVSAEEPLPGGYSLRETPELKRLHAATPARGSDWLVCSWFLQRKEQFEKWWIIEWDTFCGISADEYYSRVWDFDFVAASVMLGYRGPQWSWFKYREQMPAEFRSHATGAVPFLYLISEEALKATCRTLLLAKMTAGNGELRFATAATESGFAPCGFSPPNDRITWIPWNQVDQTKAIFHPVKYRVRVAKKVSHSNDSYFELCFGSEA